jgi:hypothetical protein
MAVVVTGGFGRFQRVVKYHCIADGVGDCINAKTCIYIRLVNWIVDTLLDV